MKHPNRILAYSALALIVMLAAFGAIAFDTSNVAHAQTVPMAPTLTAQASGASTINLSWDAVPDAASYELWAWDNVNEWQRLDGGATSPLTATTFAHTGLTSGTTYYYQVRAVNASGGVSAWSDRVNEVAGTTAPARPVLTATAGYQQITVSWPTVPGTARYELWAWDNSWTRLDGGATNPLTDTSYTHTGLTAGRTYYYQARATNSDGVMSAWSAQVSAVVLSSPNISAPTSFMAAHGDQMITLTWGAPASIAGLTLAGYEYRYAASGATLPATWMSAGNVLTTNVFGLNNGTTYNFELRAVSTTDAKGDVAMASATPSTVPDAPMLTATEGYRLVMLSWDAPANNGAAITNYHIEILNNQNQWVSETSLPGSATSYTDRGLRDSAVYTYRIIAENVAGRSSASNSAAATTLAQPAQAPGPPSSIAAGAGAGMVTLTWGAPLFNGGAPITEYEYRYKVATANSYGSWMSAMTELTVDVKPLMPGTVYDFEVRARNSVGAGDAVNTENLGDADKMPTATAPTAVPRLRTTLGAHAGTAAGVARHQSTATITVSWDALGPTVNGGAEITDYELCYKKSTDSAWMTWDDTDPGFSDPAAVGGGGALWSAVHGADAANGLLDPGTTYQYRARALNSVSSTVTANDACTHWDGDWSNVVSATTPVVAPAPPTLAASDDTTNGWVLDVNSITIKWTAPTETGGADITSYEVWFGTTMVDDADIATISPTVTNLPSSRTEFISIGLSSMTPYHYRVRARNGSGDSRVGDWSDEQSGTTTVTQAGTPGQAGTPELVGSVATDGSVTIEWTAPTNQGTSPITKYEVQYQRDDDDDDDNWDDASLGTPNPPAALTWTHMQAPGGSTIEYRVRAVNGSGAGEWSEELRQVVAARAADAPMLTATAVGDDEILLQWTIPEDNGTGITGFNIQQWDSTTDPSAPVWGTVNLLTAGGMDSDTELTVFSVTPLSAGTKFYFRIQATGTPPGEWSAENIADAASDTTVAGLPDAPTITSVTAGMGDDADSITVVWTAPNSGGSDILGYELRKWDGSNWMLEASPAAGATMYKDEGLAPGMRHYYVLAARNSMGRGPWSDEMSVMTETGNPDAPMLTAVATGADSIQLSWTVPDSNGATITGYQLVRWDNADPGDWEGDNLLTGATLADTDAETVTEFEDTGLEAGTKYYYRIRALPQTADAGWSATGMSDAISATTHGDTPERPTWETGAFAPTANSLVLVWEAPTMTGGSAITGYELRIWNGSQWAPEATLGNVLTYTDMNLDAGTKYYYVVRAINGQGAGLWSAFKAGTTTAADPDAPVLTAMPQGMNAVRLTWTVPDDNGTPITGYELQRWETLPDPDAWGDTNLLGDTDNNITLFVDEMRMPGMTYYYRVRATTDDDPSSWSGIQSATTVAGAPGRPMMVMAAADGQNAIDLTWQAAMANGSAVVRYELQRWDAGMWRTIRNDLPSTRTSYKDTMLTADTRYVYRLRAVNRAADNDGMGKWSTLVSTSTAK